MKMEIPNIYLSEHIKNHYEDKYSVLIPQDQMNDYHTWIPAYYLSFYHGKVIVDVNDNHNFCLEKKHKIKGKKFPKFNVNLMQLKDYFIDFYDEKNIAIAYFNTFCCGNKYYVISKGRVYKNWFYPDEVIDLKFLGHTGYRNNNEDSKKNLNSKSFELFGFTSIKLADEIIQVHKDINELNKLNPQEILSNLIIKDNDKQVINTCGLEKEIRVIEKNILKIKETLSDHKIKKLKMLLKHKDTLLKKCRQVK